MNKTLLEFRQEQLKRTEESLKLAGCLKCNCCNYWVDKSYIISGICDKCNLNKKERL